MESDIVFVLSYQIIIFKKLVYKILYSIHILFNVKIGTCWYNDLMTALQVDHSTTVDYRTLGTFKDVSLSSMNMHFPDTLPHVIFHLSGCLKGLSPLHQSAHLIIFFTKKLIISDDVKFDENGSDIVSGFSYQIIIFKIIYFAAFRYLQ